MEEKEIEFIDVVYDLVVKNDPMPIRNWLDQNPSEEMDEKIYDIYKYVNDLKRKDKEVG